MAGGARRECESASAWTYGHAVTSRGELWRTPDSKTTWWRSRWRTCSPYSRRDLAADWSSADCTGQNVWCCTVQYCSVVSHQAAILVWTSCEWVQPLCCRWQILPLSLEVSTDLKDEYTEKYKVVVSSGWKENNFTFRTSVMSSHHLKTSMSTSPPPLTWVCLLHHKMYCDLYMTPLWRTSCLSEDAVLTWHFQMFTRNSQTVTCNLCSYLFIGFSLGDPKVTWTTVTSLFSLCCARECLVDKLDVSSVCWRKIFKNKTQAVL